MNTDSRASRSLEQLLLILLAATTLNCSDTGSPPADTADTGPDFGTLECESEGAPIAPEAHRAGELPEPLGETPRLLWTRLNDCTGEREYRAAQKEYLLSAIERAADDERADVLVALNQEDRLSGGVVHSVSMLAPRSGDVMDCHEIGREMAAVESPIIANAGSDQVFFSMESSFGEVPEGVDPSEHDFLEVRAIGLGDGVSWGWSFSPSDYAVGHGALSPYGQFVVNTGRRHVAAIDITTGTLEWVADVDELMADTPNSSVGPVYATAPGRLYAMAYTDAQQKRIFELDECGSPSQLPGLYLSRSDVDSNPNLPPERIWPSGGPYGLGAYQIVPSEQGIHVFDSEWTELAREEDCHDAVSLSAAEFACSRLDDAASELTVVARDLATGERTVQTLPAPDDLPGEASTFRFDGTLIAGADRVVITTARYRMHDGTEQARIFVVPLDDPASRRTIDLDPLEESSSTGRMPPPLLLHDGTLVVSWHGAIFAVQTAVPGLAAGPFPRGVRLGGNENRGYVSAP